MKIQAARFCINRNFFNFILLGVFSFIVVVGLGLWKVQPQENWDAFSEDFVWCRIDDAQNDGIFANYGLLGIYENVDEKTAWTLYEQDQLPDGERFIPYTRQNGFQGTLDSALAITMQAMGFGNKAIQNAIWTFNSIVLVFVVLLLSLWIFKEMGWEVSLGAASCIFLSSWLTRSMANAYWVTWTMFLPLVIVAFIGRKQMNTGHVGKTLYVTLFAGILVRFLCGFEFTSTIMLATEVPILYYFLNTQDRQKQKRWIYIAFLIGVLELIAFVTAMGITIIQIMCWDQQGIASAWEIMMNAIKKRTGVMMTANDIQQYSETIANSLAVGRIYVVKKYLFSSEILWGTWSVGEILLFWGISALVRKVLTNCSIKEILKQGIIIVASMLTAISWYFLASAHAYIHTGLDYLLWLIPFVPFCIGFIFQNTVDVIKSIVGTVRKFVEI